MLIRVKGSALASDTIQCFSNINNWVGYVYVLVAPCEFRSKSDGIFRKGHLVGQSAE